MTQDAPIIIAGGGIGGLAAAIGLAQKGFPSIVLEKAPQLGEIGAGIQLGPNAFHSFDYLGVGDAARSMAVYIDSLRLMDAISGEEITRIPLDDAFRTRFKNPYAVVHRGDLHGVFLRACQDHDLVELRTSSRVCPATRPIDPSFPPKRCRKTCVGTPPPYGPARNAISSTILCRAGKSSTWLSPTTMTHRNPLPANRSAMTRYAVASSM